MSQPYRVPPSTARPSTSGTRSPPATSQRTQSSGSANHLRPNAQPQPVIRSSVSVTVSGNNSRAHSRTPSADDESGRRHTVHVMSNETRTRPLTKHALLNVNDTQQPHSAGAVSAPSGMSRSSSGSDLTAIRSGSAAAAYAASLTVDARNMSAVLSTYGADGKHDESIIPSEVECFENQRYYPIVGWSKKMLPTDRPSWSNADGNAAKQFDDFKNVYGWQWTTDWIMDTTSGDSDGWTYMSDFSVPWNGVATKEMQHVVRRRRWYRKRGPIGGKTLSGFSATRTVDLPKTQNARPQMPNAANNAAANSLTVGTSAINRVGSSPQPLSSLYTQPPAQPQPPPPPKKISAIVIIHEHQRYYPIAGWSVNLLPTDKVASFTTPTGQRAKPRDEITANGGVVDDSRPSATQSNNQTATTHHHTHTNAHTNGAGEHKTAMDPPRSRPSSGGAGWKWSGEWKFEANDRSDRDGWSYAVDFPSNPSTSVKWLPKKGIDHFVRRRIWFREKVRVESMKRPKTNITALLQRLDLYEKDLKAEERDENVVSTLSATW